MIDDSSKPLYELNSDMDRGGLDQHVGNGSKGTSGSGARTRFRWRSGSLVTIGRRCKSSSRSRLFDTTGGIKSGQFGNARIVIDAIGTAASNGSEFHGATTNILGLFAALVGRKACKIGTTLTAILALAVALDGIILLSAGALGHGTTLSFVTSCRSGQALVGILA